MVTFSGSIYSIECMQSLTKCSITIIVSETEPGLSRGLKMALVAFWLRGEAKTISEVAGLFGCHGYPLWMLLMHNLSKM